IYAAVYSGIPVFETVCRGIAVMKRRSDHCLNATQILKVAGIEKGRRTKILEREVLTGEHEKVQGGYGKYQGTWVPFDRGIELAEQYGVDHYLRALFEYEPARNEDGSVDRTPTKEQALLAHRRQIAAVQAHTHAHADYAYPPATMPAPAPLSDRHDSNGSLSGMAQVSMSGMRLPPLQSRLGSFTPRPSASQTTHTLPPAKRQRRQDGYRAARAASLTPSPVLEPARHDAPPTRQRPTHHHLAVPDASANLSLPATGLFSRTTAKQTAPGRHTHIVACILTDTAPPPDLNVNLVIDDQGHTALHWAAALARIHVLRLLVERGADVLSVNYAGESALMRAVLVTNNYEKDTFAELLELLGRAITLRDARRRTVLHHIALHAGIHGRVAAARYYMGCLLRYMMEATTEEDLLPVLDAQDRNGDTALCVAARVGCRAIMEQLIDAGARRDLRNNVDLGPDDFGVLDGLVSADEMLNSETPRNGVGAARSRELLAVVDRLVTDLDNDFDAALRAKQEQVAEARQRLREATRELAEARRTANQLRRRSSRLAEAQLRAQTLSDELELLREEDGEDAGESEDEELQTTAGPLDGIKKEDTVGSAQNVSNHTGVDDLAEDADLERLHAILAAFEARDRELTAEIHRLEARDAAKESRYRRLIAMCCGVPLTHVDQLLGALTAAVESDGDGLDLERVEDFLRQVRANQ
ncbi:hypothetical protein THASP1DRAFT_8195, partial [Thamnocephalis sphaerospora]